MTSFEYDDSRNSYYAQIGVMLVGAMALRHLSWPRLAGCIEALTLKLAISAAAALGSAMLAATAFPLVDEMLIRWDAYMGFDWLAAMRALEGHPRLIRILYDVYPTLGFQMFVLVPALFLSNQEKRCWTFIAAWGVALACSMSLFPFFPAVGPIVFHDYLLPGIPFKNEHMDVFMGARDGSLRVLGASTIRGMVTFPSFHVAGAVLLAWSGWSLRWLRWPFVLLNVLMLVSAIPIGGHYLSDVVAGTIIAAFSIWIAKWLVQIASTETAAVGRSKFATA